MEFKGTKGAPLAPAIVDVKGAARLTGLSRTTIYRLCGLQDFAPRVRLSEKRFGFKIADLEHWIDARREAAA